MDFNVPSVGRAVPSCSGLHAVHLTKHEPCERAWDSHVVERIAPASGCDTSALVVLFGENDGGASLGVCSSPIEGH